MIKAHSKEWAFSCSPRSIIVVPARKFLLYLLLPFLSVFPAFSEKVADLPAPTGYIDDNAHVLSPTAISKWKR
jgi:hypothetical protein